MLGRHRYFSRAVDHPSSFEHQEEASILEFNLAITRRPRGGSQPSSSNHVVHHLLLGIPPLLHWIGRAFDLELCVVRRRWSPGQGKGGLACSDPQPQEQGGLDLIDPTSQSKDLLRKLIVRGL